MNIIIAAAEPEFLDPLIEHFGYSENIDIHYGDIFEVECDAIVSPANSFGFMDGGFDLALSQRYGWHLQESIQKLIDKHHGGELLVGQAETIETGDPDMPYVIVAPTMRIPMRLPADTINPYLATKAVLRHIATGIIKDGKHVGQPVNEHIRTVAFTGMGTGIGTVPYENCARQMAAAIKDHQQNRAFPTWLNAVEHHQTIIAQTVER